MQGALERMQTLVERSPRSASILCEAGYIAHLAADERAEPWLRRGVSALAALPMLDASQRQTQARCEYNLGLVYQSRRYLHRAERYFEDSLRHRDNDVVHRRLEAVRTEIDDLEHAVVADTLDSMVETLESSNATDDGCDWAGRALAQAGEGGQRAGFIEVAATDCYMDGGGTLYFAYGPPEEVTAYFIDSFEEDDDDAAAENTAAWSDFSFERTGTGDEGHWRASFTSTARHSILQELLPPGNVVDAPVCDYMGSARWTSEHVVLCDAGAERCAHLVISRTAVRSAGEVHCEGVDSDPPTWALRQAGLAADGSAQASTTRVEHRLEIQFDGDRVRIRTVEGEPDAGDAPADGEHTVEALLANPRLSARRIRS